MARARSLDRGPPSLHRTLFTPGVYLWRMFVFLVLVGLLVAVLHKQLWEAMLNNPGLNFLIVLVLLAGILYSFQQVLRLYPEIRWVNAFRIADPGLAISHRPVLLAPMATMLRDRQGTLSLSATSMRSIMDSIGSRLDEARDTGRYLVGLLVFLGLLGTFWGLLDTIQSVGRTISTLDTKGDGVAMFDELKAGLAAPLRGMGTAFSSSLLGLGGSLVIGFLELQASHAHGRFYNQLEEWLSGITELAPGGSQTSDLATHQLYSAVHEMHRAVVELSDRIGAMPRVEGGGAAAEEAVKDLAKGVDQLVRQMRAEQKVVREWVDEQAAQQSEVASVLKDLAANVARKG
ncbi:MAG: flagellar motor protein MotA [Hyphomicrobiaceae bacterium]|nr:MAG: flagellar motor protein MotA [Hyphomicrobiaceae bacterium]